MFERVEKPWGYTQLLFRNDVFEVHRIKVKRGGYCSVHKHNTKYNMFYIEYGGLGIHEQNEDGTGQSYIYLRDGDSLHVPPGQYHKFYAHEDTVAYEIYYVRADQEDISRLTTGGWVSTKDETEQYTLGLRSTGPNVISCYS